ncbi:MAG: hypothetical protein WC455_10150 [Dehalococcoidia bacterium]|jgi:hypothetical protein
MENVTNAWSVLDSSREGSLKPDFGKSRKARAVRKTRRSKKK